MLYVLICEDKPDSEELRKSVRSDHLAFLKDYDVRFAGPMLGEDETTMIGSIIVIEAESWPVSHKDRACMDSIHQSSP